MKLVLVIIAVVFGLSFLAFWLCCAAAGDYDQKATTVQCKMTGHLVELPCSASGCPLFGDCLSEHKRITRTPQTNADRIRAMSDEELAELLYNGVDSEYCSNDPACADLLDTEDGVPEEKCIGCLMKWLQRPTA